MPGFYTNENVLIISGQETFSVHGLQKKLDECGFGGEYVEAKLKPFMAVEHHANLIVYYMDESVYDNAAFLVYVKDLCLEEEKSLILIGRRNEYDEVLKSIPKDCILEWFERPLHMDVFLDTVEDYMDKEKLRMHKKSILIVDDDVTYMQMIREWLKDSYKITMVDSGIKAIKWLTMNEADLVLLDYELPITSGPQIYEMLKSDTDTDEVPVMFLTGQMDRRSVLTAMKLKPVDYLIKTTIDRKTLREKLDTYFELKKGKSSRAK